VLTHRSHFQFNNNPNLQTLYIHTIRSDNRIIESTIVFQIETFASAHLGSNPNPNQAYELSVAPKIKIIV